MFDLPELKTLKAAEVVLRAQDKINAAIKAEVAKIPDLVLGRFAAERALGAAEIEGEATATKKARVALTDRQGEIDATAGKLRRLRAALVALGPELAQRYEGLAGEVPEFNAAIAEQFRAAWDQALADFANVLAARVAVEQLVGPLDLPEPAAGLPVELGCEMTYPRETLDNLKAGVQTIADMSHAAKRTWVVPPGVSVRDYDAQRGVYILTRNARGLSEGTVVIDCSFPDGVLRNLVESSSWAVPYTDPEQQRAMREAEKALRRLDQADAEAVRRANEAEAKQKVLDRRAAVAQQIGEDPYPDTTKVTHTTAGPGPSKSFMGRLVGDIDAAEMERFGPRVNPD